MRIKYCCAWYNTSLFLDSHGSRETAVVFCSACQTIMAEIWLTGPLKGKNVLGEEE